MKRRLSWLTAAGFMVVLSLFVTGCKSKEDTGSSSPKVTVQSEVPEEPTVTEQTEIETFDVNALESELTGISLSIQAQAHNIYKGRFGDEEVIVSIWPEPKQDIAYVSFAGSYHSDKLSFECELSEDGIRYQNNDYYLLLREQTDGKLAGYYYETGSKVAECQLDLSYINASQDREHLYSIGSDSSVEKFAEKIIDSVNGEDLETFTEYIQYPITITMGDKPVTFESKSDFLKWDEADIFTQEFLNAMMDTYPEFMFSNGEDGVMVGSDSYNVWINKNEDGRLKIVAMNH